MKWMGAVAALIVAVPAGATDPGYWAALRAVDARMAAIAYRLATGNAELCRDLQPVPGFQLHAIDQYGKAAQAGARAAFDFARPVQVEVVVPGSPAAIAGIAPDDALVAVGDAMVVPADPTVTASSVTRDAAQALLARQPVDTPLTVTLERGGVRRIVTVAPSPGCRSAFEVLLGPALKASSDGRTVQVGVRYFERNGDDAIAAIVAHELSHTILRHRARLEAAGVKWGLLAQFGRNARLFRRTEEDADRLSVHLLRNAGYDPQVAVRFWRDEGGKDDRGFFRGATHPTARTRADALVAEIATMPALGKSLAPPVLATRDDPLN